MGYYNSYDSSGPTAAATPVSTSATAAMVVVLSKA